MKKNNKKKKKKKWNIEIAKNIAKHENITLTTEHWEIIYMIRNYYKKYNFILSNRTLIKAMKNSFPEEKCNSFYLIKLFPQGIAKQANKIAGIPKSNICL
ncbi:TusE/DsrC/DsvC family sulfur relay protein [Buchnera aphidicola]|uniref:TusE/DsrC/DsvC family sulfur relay protein n=1 Tax=Buchnera aphidicola TaxID=9 RepID=UPI0031B85C52